VRHHHTTCRTPADARDATRSGAVPREREPYRLGQPLSVQALLDLQATAGNRVAVAALGRAWPGGSPASTRGRENLEAQRLCVQRHAIAPQRDSGEEDEEEGSGQTRRAQRLPLQRLGALAVQRENWLKKQWNKYRHPKTGAFNIRRGEALPSDKEMASKTFEEHWKAQHGDKMLYEVAQTRELQVALQILSDPARVNKLRDEVAESYKLQKKEDPPTEEDLQEFWQAAGYAVAGAKDLVDANRTFIKLAKGNSRSKALMALWNAFSPLVSEGVAENLRQDPSVGPDREFITKELTFGAAAQGFLDKRKNVKLEAAYVPREDIPKFAAALKKMPTVEFILSGGGAEQHQPREGEARREWKGGGRLVDGIEEVDDAVIKWLSKRRLKSRKFRRRVDRADDWTRAFLSAEMIARIPRPKVIVHSKPSPSFRANGGGGLINVAYNEATNVIAHEIGHVLEEHLPMRTWHDIHLLLGTRHAEAGGGPARSGENIVTKYTEGRWGGKYVTGRYTSTAYRSGNAEVVSMALEFFSKPADALKLIEGDPLHAAIVLRGFKPEEYAATDALRPFDRYLPHE